MSNIKKFFIFIILILIFSCKKEKNTDFDFSPFPVYDQDFDVILLIGQSNTCSGRGFDPKLDTTNSLVFQLGRYEENNLKIIPAKEPLSNLSLDSAKIGFATTFSNLYIRNGYLKSGRKLLLIPCGKGGTGFISHEWNRGDTLYKDAVRRAKGVLALNTRNKLVCILWHQGEQDVAWRPYQKTLDGFINSIRNDIVGNINVPFILGGMVPYWTEKSEWRIKQQSIISNTPLRDKFTGYADPNLPFLIKKVDDEVDMVHYDAIGLRILGVRYFNEYCRIINESK
jgi:hypothetical protein